MAKVIPGKLLLATLNGVETNCQQDATLTINYNVTQEEPCKPSSSETYKGFSWQTSVTDSASWSLAFSIKSTDLNSANQNTILANLISNGNQALVTFETSDATGVDLAYSSIFTGDGLISDFTWNAPQAGESTVDITVTGNGAPSFIVVPITT